MLRPTGLLLASLLLAACGAAPPGGGSGSTGAGPGPAVPATVAPAAAASTPALVADGAMHPVASADATPTPAVDPVTPAAGRQASVLAPSRPRAPLIRPALPPGLPPLTPIGNSEVPEAPYAKADAMPARCSDPRPANCSLDYKPVCADVDTGVRCVRAPCPEASARKTFGSACKACRDPKVAAYVEGRCPPA